MKNGTGITLRPIRPEDEPLMVKFHETLSDRSVYLRYFHSLSLSSRVAHDRLVRICFVDYDREMAIVAEHRDADGHPRILGVGRLVKAHAKNEGEVAVLISDAYQNQGLGTELFRRVIQVARDEKLARVDAEILPDNLSMKKIAKHLGFRVQGFDDPSSIRAILDL
jgi:acetyltransferase